MRLRQLVLATTLTTALTGTVFAGAASAAPVVPDGLTSAEAVAAANEATLNVAWEKQSTGYYCGPTATRMALKSWGNSNPPSQKALAKLLGTTTDGTAHIGKITDVLNGQVGNHYRNRKFKDGRAVCPRSGS